MSLSAQQRKSWRQSLVLASLLALGVLTPFAASAQGCSQCRESVGQTPARTRQAYRRGITALVLAATGVFLATLTAVRRYR